VDGDLGLIQGMKADEPLEPHPRGYASNALVSLAKITGALVV
jgi:hypothetical protein